MTEEAKEKETVNHPPHYNQHPSGIECIDVIEPMSFNLGNALKYIWRAGAKGDAKEDYRKALWYMNRELARVQSRKMIDFREQISDEVIQNIEQGFPLSLQPVVKQLLYCDFWIAGTVWSSEKSKRLYLREQRLLSAIGYLAQHLTVWEAKER